MINNSVCNNQKSKGLIYGLRMGETRTLPQSPNFVKKVSDKIVLLAYLYWVGK